MMASAANGGGTKITDALAPVARTPSPRYRTPAGPGAWCRPCRAPRRPRSACRKRSTAARGRCLPAGEALHEDRVFSSTSMLIAASRTTFFGGVLHAVRDREVQTRFGRILAALLHVGAFHPHHDREPGCSVPARRHHAGGQRVAAQDAAEDVDQHRLDVGRRAGCGRRCASARRWRRRPRPGSWPGCRRVLDDVHGGHGQAGAVHHAAHGAVQLDVVQAVACEASTSSGSSSLRSRSSSSLVAVEALSSKLILASSA
jgi:hypothetical protein